MVNAKDEMTAVEAISLFIFAIPHRVMFTLVGHSSRSLSGHSSRKQYQIVTGISFKKFVKFPF